VAELIIISTLNGVLYGMLLFLMASGLTLIFSMMGVLNLAHASFYMLGAFFGFRSANGRASGRRSSSRR
jgi:branched-chain amino acid transport system permease protein